MKRMDLPGYALGYSEIEYERLIRQAERYGPVTERLFRRAGIASSQHVLDVGSGVGDVSMLLARIVGSGGEVVGIERDARSVALARARAAEAGLHNVTFTESDVNHVPSNRQYDAVVGRFILQFLPDPTDVLRSLSRLVRAHGIVAFQEISWAPMLKLVEHLPLYSTCASLCHETMLRAGANTDSGLNLHRVFMGAGLRAPTSYLEMLLGDDADLARWIYDILLSLRPQIAQNGLSLEKLGDLDTLRERLHAEVLASKGVISSPGLVGAWSNV